MGSSEAGRFFHFLYRYLVSELFTYLQRDKWWQRIGHGSIEDEISEYKARLNDAGIRFQVC